MKKLKIAFFSLFICAGLGLTAQTTTSKIPVNGNCGMCKSKIEKAAKSTGATYAAWDVDGKSLTVTYDAKKNSEEKIQNAVAAAGYDTRDVKATDKAYTSLEGCCQYDRSSSKVAVKESTAHACGMSGGKEECCAGKNKECKMDEKQCGGEAGKKSSTCSKPSKEGAK